jgi:hypothetical protein
VLLGGPHKGQRRPRPLEGMLVEKRDAAQRDGAGAACVVLDVLDVEAGGAQFFRRNLRRGLVLMVCQLAHGPDIHLLGPLGQAAELQVCDQALT